MDTAVDDFAVRLLTLKIMLYVQEKIFCVVYAKTDVCINRILLLLV